MCVQNSLALIGQGWAKYCDLSVVRHCETLTNHDKDFQSSCELVTWANSKYQRLSTHNIQELLFSILKGYRPRKWFSLTSGHLHVHTIQSLRTVYFSALSNNLSNWHPEQFCSHKHYTKRIWSSADETSRLTISSLIFARFTSVFSCFSAHFRNQLVESLTSWQI